MDVRTSLMWSVSKSHFFCIIHTNLYHNSFRQRELSLTHYQREVCQISLGPTSSRATGRLPRRHIIAKRNRENDNLQRKKDITTLYFWLCFVARSEANRLYIISVGLLKQKTQEVCKIPSLFHEHVVQKSFVSLGHVIGNSRQKKCNDLWLLAN